MLVKYCGIKNEEEFNMVLQSQAHYIGFIFFKGSKRYVSPASVMSWLETHSFIDKQLVGVFVNEEIRTIHEIAKQASLDVIQCHGQETVEQLQLLKDLGYEVWKALPHQQDTLEKMKKYRDVVDGYVIDSKVKDQFGGTGITFDWTDVPAYTKQAVYDKKKCLIAGGITSHNVTELLTHHPIGLDLSSGIETDGLKDSEKITVIERNVFYDIQQA
ncbi:phosphoribosylanthranilate isomerase [Metabacillus iocasae]|uniref:N-(5'-phosphoribosyl)anthranilate isomerase n=1 Tax=Priestia iocasae TaxID=2291674 RepID=A0ABS2QQK0_9BACI|nr:phosphoribosylanthranilate isomerase [Metabacillus iocasae]MBM7701729.1 phosphoribosylanthranilate isomerase [Metabacillus iocasae]